MGCSDVYCTLCGCPMNSAPLEREDFEDNLEIKKTDITKIIKLNEQAWLGRCTLLLKKDDIILKNYYETECSNYFEKDDDSPIYRVFTPESGEEEESFPDENLYHVHGIAVHSSCYNFIAKEKGVKLKFSDFPELEKYDFYRVKNVEYLLEKYQKQDFDFTAAFLDGHEELLKAPTKSLKKRKDIIKIYNQIFN